MARQVQGGAAIPVAVIDPDTRQVQGGAALPVVNVGEPVASLQFDTSVAIPSPHVEGLVFWDSTEGTLAVMTQIQNVLIQVGDETQVVVRNDTGSPILNGQAVYVSAIVSGRISVALARADDLTTLFAIGIATEDIADLSEGRVTAFGLVRTIDTSAFSPGDVVWLSGSVAGDLTATRPAFPDFTLRLGRVVVSDASDGKLFIAARAPENIGEFGSIFVTGGAAAQALTATVEAKLTAFTTNGPSQIVTPDAANDEIGAFEPGVHEVSAQFSFTSSANNVVFEYRFAVNGTSSSIRAQRKSGSAGDVGSASFIGQLELAADDEVSVNVEADTNTNLTVTEAQLNIVKL